MAPVIALSPVMGATLEGGFNFDIERSPLELAGDIGESLAIERDGAAAPATGDTL